MNITANTTDAQILRSVKSAKDSLMQAATMATESDLMVGEKLVKNAQAVRNYEALAHVQMQYRNICQNNPANRDRFLFEVATQSDDTWSGRGNDSARSEQDAIRNWAKDQMDHLRYEA